MGTGFDRRDTSKAGFSGIGFIVPWGEFTFRTGAEAGQLIVQGKVGPVSN